MKQHKGQKLKMIPGIYYVWVAGSCDYGHEERCSGGAYTMIQNEEIIETYIMSDDHTTEFRIILSTMIHAMEVLPEGADIVFITNVSYIQQNFDRVPNQKSANPDLILQCIEEKKRHNSVEVKIVQYHKSPLLIETHNMATKVMAKTRKDYHLKNKNNGLQR